MSAGVESLRVDETNRKAANAGIELIHVVRVGSHPDPARERRLAVELEGLDHAAVAKLRQRQRAEPQAALDRRSK